MAMNIAWLLLLAGSDCVLLQYGEDLFHCAPIRALYKDSWIVSFICLMGGSIQACFRNWIVQRPSGSSLWIPITTPRSSGRGWLGRWVLCPVVVFQVVVLFLICLFWLISLPSF
ncbi:hypothetical protein P152DRAFT_71312 [Eremomyces bilateralis CBS 781.70]|uniref:Uncharacterized protein n=1 Tax=Eremomyces bilateralis CBS 781.70 TaxID=1392243 RepID=A0A6G1FZU2_9PEZI|nr:uncharacterized protein P152DRAFT_71312 [Eremomyces bilateralis CBS 781.70]KAF1811377.1 hypothetical protein P152DRAFT_71312 [Eremomyces bilateralis CBS 781.70]